MLMRLWRNSRMHCWYSYSGKGGSFLRNWTCAYPSRMTQQLYSWALTPEKCKLTGTQKLVTNVHSSLICHSLQLDTTQMPRNRLKKLARLYLGTLLGNRKGTDYWYMPTPRVVLKRIMLRVNKPVWFHLYSTPERQNYEYMKNRSVLGRARKWG